MYDVIVIGAGPAGSAAARAAAKMGLDALVMEKEIFPRYKPCGGALSERALSLLDFDLPKDLCERTITGARVHFQNKVMERHKGYRLITMVTRSRFDDFLLQKAQESGAKLIIQKALDYKEKEDCVEVLTKEDVYRSRFLVVSSGYQDKLKDKIRGQDPSDQHGICMVTEIEEDDEKIEEKLHASLDIYFGVAAMGYGWIFPHKRYYSVGIGGLASRLKHPRKIMLDFLRKNDFQGDYRLHGHLIPLGGKSRRTAGSRVLLAGDSAGFVDAFTGEGIFYALRSGQIATQVISEKLSDGSVDVSRAYESRCKRDFGEELRYALLLSKLMHSRPEIFLRVLTCQEDVLDRYIEIAAARRTYKNFVRWLVPRLPLDILRII